MALKVTPFFLLILQSSFVQPTVNKTHSHNLKSVRAGHSYFCEIRDHPYVVSIRYTLNYRHHCTGTAISQLWVLTAAGCARHYYTPGTFTVTAGTSFIGIYDINVFRQDVQEALVTRNYLPPFSKQDDVALMELDYPLRETAHVGFIKVATHAQNRDRNVEEVCASAVVAGWSDYYPSDTGVALSHNIPLQCTNFQAASPNNCSKGASAAMCSKKNICKVADLGSPVICNDVQYGVVTLRSRCVSKVRSGVQTRVDAYEDFILRTTGSGCVIFRLKLSFILISIAIILYQ